MGLFLPGDRSFVVFDAELADKLGINAAIILSRIIWSIEKHITANDRAFFIDGRWWMYDTKGDLSAYSKLTEKQIRLVLTDLRKLQILHTGQFDNTFGVRRNWFAVDTLKLLAVISMPIGTKGPDREKQPIETKGPDSPIETKGPDTSGRKGPIESDERARYILITKSHTESPSESHKPLVNNVTPIRPPPRQKKPKVFKHTADDLEVAKLWLEFAISQMKWSAPPKSWTAENFAEDLVKVRESLVMNNQPMNHFGLEALLKFIKGSAFWSQNAWSPAGLLKKSASDKELRKVDQIFKQFLKEFTPESVRQEERMKDWAPFTEEELNSNPFSNI